MYYVYILNCSDSKTYIGCTKDLKARVKRHQTGNVPATRSRLPVLLRGYIAFTEEVKAFQFEKYLKTGSGRAFISKRIL